jgi:hypothetical protein
LTHGKQGSASFWKKKQKLLLIGARVAATRAPYKQKFFGSFFQKGTLALYSLEPFPNPGCRQIAACIR